MVQNESNLKAMTYNYFKLAFTLAFNVKNTFNIEQFPFVLRDQLCMKIVGTLNSFCVKKKS